MLNGVVSLIVSSCEDNVTCRLDDVASDFAILGLEVQSIHRERRSTYTLITFHCMSSLNWLVLATDTVCRKISVC